MYTVDQLEDKLWKLTDYISRPAEHKVRLRTWEGKLEVVFIEGAFTVHVPADWREVVLSYMDIFQYNYCKQHQDSTGEEWSEYERGEWNDVYSPLRTFRKVLGHQT